MKPRSARALEDIFSGLKNYSFWTYLAWHDIRIRYRNSVLGPLWITVSTGIFCITIGFVYSEVFLTDISEMMPFVTIGSIVWNFMSGFIGEMPSAFVTNAGYIKNMHINPMVILLRMLFRSVIVLSHHCLIVIGVCVYFSIWPGSVALLAIPGLFIILLNMLALGIALSIAGARFRDVEQITHNLLMMAFFVTPVFWLPRALPEGSWILAANPLHHLISLVRSPLLGQIPAASSWFVSVATFVASLAVAVFLYARARDKIALWV